MKRFIILLMVLALLGLTACGGGGGGGGGGSSGNNNPGGNNPGSNPGTDWGGPPALPLPPAAGSVSYTLESDVCAYAIKDGNAELVDYHNGFNISKVTGGLRLDAPDREAPRDFELTVGAGDFTNTPDDKFIMAVRETALTPTGDNLAVGDFTALDILYLGGKKAGLQHSDFGVWHAYFRFVPTGGVVSQQRTDAVIPFVSGDSSKEMPFTQDTADLQFNGLALGQAKDMQHAAELFGEATLDVNLSNLSGVLELNFADFYKFTASGLNFTPSGSNPSGAFAGNTTLTATPNANSTGITFDAATASGAWVRARPYGDGTPQPTEVTGTFSFVIQGDNPTTVVGTYGVK